jgi:hypothetical protein
VPDYDVKVTYTYPVSALTAEDAFSTVPVVIRSRFIGFLGKGSVEISDGDGNVVLRGELTDKEKSLTGATISKRG